MHIFSDPSVIDFRDLGTDTFVKDDALTVNFEIDLSNVASAASGNDILVSSGNNYDFSVFLSDGDIRAGGGGATVLGTGISISSSLSVGLIAQDATPTTMTGSVSLTLPAASCNSYTFVCTSLTDGTGAAFTDADILDSSNAYCYDIINRMYCNPGKLLRVYFEQNLTIITTYVILSYILFEFDVLGAQVILVKSDFFHHSVYNNDKRF